MTAGQDFVKQHPEAFKKFLRALIKAEAFVKQHPEESKRLVDYVLPAAEMPAQLIAYAAHAFGKRSRPVSPSTPRAEDLLKKICILLRAQTGHDFSLYKQNTLVRRVERRMAVHQINRMDGYVRYLQQNLAEGEALFLVTSETVGEFVDLFAPLDRKWKLYQRKGEAQGAHRPAMGKFIPPLTADGAARGPATAERHEVRKVPLRELAEQSLIHEYTPASVVVNERGDVLYIHGRTGRYLEPAPGDAGMNITRMVREGLRRELATALHKAAARKETARYPELRVKINGDFINVNLTVRPLTAGPLDPATGSEQVGDKGRPEATAAGLFLVSFEDAPTANVRSGKAGGTGGGDDDSGPGHDRGGERSLHRGPSTLDDGPGPGDGHGDGPAAGEDRRPPAAWPGSSTISARSPCPRRF